MDTDKLDSRKMAILNAIIRNYLETGEPVGSRTISKFTDLSLSSATIRNEMADLEELGYLVQPHTSAGRIPSDKGYRLYVDKMMEEKVEEVNNMKEVLDQKADRIENLLKKVAKLLAVNTNYASMITTPKYRSRKLKFIQLTNVDDTHLLAIIFLEGNIPKNKVIDADHRYEESVLLKLNIVLNSLLQDLDLEEINMSIIQKIKEQAGEDSALIGRVLDAIGEAIREEDNIEVYTSGATNILNYPELSSDDGAKRLLYTLEDKQELAELVDDKLTSESGEHTGTKGDIQVYIGNETPIDSMKNCSVVTATYEIEEGVYGKVGIIGPKRMDYDKVVGTLKTLMTQLDEIFKKK